MELKCIITLASASVRIPFTAMERSLRAVGCDLPVRVIPFNDDKFELPANSEWWILPEVRSWIHQSRASSTAKGMMQKYQTFLVGGYLFVDSDVVFLRDPREVFAEAVGFVTCCGHWHNPAHTFTEESRNLMAQKSTVWQSRVFNAGQFACDQPLYDFDSLRATAGSTALRSTCLENLYHDQPGMNALVFSSGVKVTNLTLPPRNVESTWAGDYRTADYRSYWTDLDRTPCFIHWAGRKPDSGLPIDELFYDHLRGKEIEAWREECGKKAKVPIGPLVALKRFRKFLKRSL